MIAARPADLFLAERSRGRIRHAFFRRHLSTKDVGHAHSFTIVTLADRVSPPKNQGRIELLSSQGAVTACQTIAKDPVGVEAGTFGVVLEQIAEGCTLTGALYMEIGVAEAGATDYISKRPNLEVLKLKVQRALDQGA